MILAATDPELAEALAEALLAGRFTLAAAVIAALAAIVAAIIGAVSANRAQQWVGREQWWTRFSWSLEKATSSNPDESELGLSVLLALLDAPWAKPEDNEMAFAVAGVIVGTTEETDGGEEA